MSKLVKTSSLPILLAANPQSRSVAAKFHALVTSVKAHFKVVPYVSTCYVGAILQDEIISEHEMIARREFQMVWFFGDKPSPPLLTVLALTLDASVRIGNHADEGSKLATILRQYRTHM